MSLFNGGTLRDSSDGEWGDKLQVQQWSENLIFFPFNASLVTLTTSYHYSEGPYTVI